MFIQPHNKKQLDDFVQRPAHALLITAPEGSGKLQCARYVAQKLLGITEKQLEAHPYVSHLSPENSSHGIESIRKLQTLLRLKVPGKQTIRRVVILEDAHRMTTEAQNALLKTLEEPPEDTELILTAIPSLALKETIYSRVQQIKLAPVTLQQALEHFSLHSAKDVKRAYMLSGGYPELLESILSNEETDLVTAIEEAKAILQKTKYERLLEVDVLSKDKERTALLLKSLRIICSGALYQAADIPANAKQWHNRLQGTYAAEAALPSNPNAKLLLVDLMLTL